MLNFLSEVTIIDVIDITIVAVLLYTLFWGFKRTRSVLVFVGIIVFSVVYVAVRLLRLRLTTFLLQGFFTVILVALVIIFQEEIRRVFEHIALWILGPKIKKSRRRFRKQIEVLTDTIAWFRHNKIGSLMILTGREHVGRHIHRGVILNGKISQQLLESIFDSHSAGHDGAVLIRADRVLEFACHLPLSKDMMKLRGRGTRHAAALGLSELSDALCIVVSEETGDASICRFGEFNEANDKERLTDALNEFYRELSPAEKSRKWNNFLTRNIKEKIAAAMISLILWFVVVYESTVIYKTFTVPVQYIGLSQGITVPEIKPREIRVVLSGGRRDFYFVDRRDIRLVLKFFDIEDYKRVDMGKEYYDVVVTASDIDIPPGLSIVNILPRNIILHIEGAAAAGAGQ